ncbi:single-stranded DNA-binding protein [Crossiella sp. CA-258035]|uniref:single-stranded DNA-binding protein n=1 Tax=Crossiella sp. CA-258035 TaxID=2981138 RepID=UPI0024BC69B7|nr:single-stranded DNA-binding protein [Crossiella sp. CA-258035]WHT22562.1 single-stranded DNA-binding protein [Crossiella sp. CA-258035]
MLNDTMIIVIGELTADPELRTTNEGAPVCNFTVKAPRRRRDRDTGAWVASVPLMLRCTVWREQAENLTASLRAGDRLLVYGRLRPRTITAQDGSSRTALELEVSECGPSLLRATAEPEPTVDNKEETA